MQKPPRESEVLASSLVNSVTQALSQLLDLWNEMGIGKELQLERMQTAKAHIETLLNEMIEEERSLKEKLENDIKRQKNQLKMLRLELKLDPFQVDENLSILQLEKEFRQALEAAREEKQVRLKELEHLQREDQSLCVELCATPYYIPTGSVPSWSELKELKEHVQKLLKVKEQRLEEFFKLRREIRQYKKEIGHTPDGTLESDMLSDEDEYIYLTKKNLEDLQLLVQKLQVKKESLTATREALEKEAQLLWDRLQWPQEQQEQCKITISKCSIAEAVKKWEEELQNLEELKKERLKEIIFKVRQDLDSYWQKCFYGDEQRAAFKPFCDDSFSEDLLSQHDEELLKMKETYAKNQLLYDAVQKWEVILDRFVELQKKSTDPSRLLNRGGNLLKDERERLKLQKQLLKLSEELKKNTENWEKENGSCFLINNQRFLDSMAYQLEQHKLKKEQPKSVMKRDDPAVTKVAVKRPAGLNTPTPQKMRKVNAASHLTVLKPANCNNVAIGTSAGKQSSQKKKELTVKSTVDKGYFNSTLKENLDC
ncbi:protein regulator of cytokinesis 1-like isoform X2 [Tiliqua scincoides]|uniref:protein regulator of cytokinesis 1-like isoform X2 n=1 Tax=Tiliqua scincoides TaxID=71010 RepID=UPI0034624359